MKCKNAHVWNWIQRFNEAGELPPQGATEEELKAYNKHAIDFVLGQKGLKGKVYAGALRMANSVQSELEIIDKARVKIVEKFQVEKDGKKSIPEDKMDDFSKEFTELLDEETELNVSKMDLSEVELPSANVYAVLDAFTKQDE